MLCATSKSDCVFVFCFVVCSSPKIRFLNSKSLVPAGTFVILFLVQTINATMAHGGGHHGGGGGSWGGGGGGGGHHGGGHHGGGGGSWVGGGSARRGWGQSGGYHGLHQHSRSREVVIINQNQQNSYVNRSFSPSWVDNSSGVSNYDKGSGGIDLHSEECLPICTICCCGFCCGVCNPKDHRPLYNRCGFWFFLTAVLWIAIAISLNPNGSNDLDFELNAGETRQILAPSTWQLASFSLTAMSQNPGLNVYAIPPGPTITNAYCPPLTGPPVTLEDSQLVVLGVDEYQYDYFHLNPGSTIAIDIDQKQGSANIFLLKGQASLEALMSQDESYSFRSHSQLKWFAGEKRPLAFTHTVQSADIYIVIYDNASSSWTSPAKLQVHYKVSLTAHDLSDAKPYCTPEVSSSADGCSWTFEDDVEKDTFAASCIIVQAVSTDHPDDPDHHDSNETVTVHVAFTLLWNKLALLGAIPLLLGVIFWSFQNVMYCCCSGDTSSNATTEPTGTHGASDAWETTPFNPPATAPGYQSTAPPEAHAVLVNDSAYYSVAAAIPVGAEHVTPVPPPDTNPFGSRALSHSLTL
jgi:hypothetical protein